MVANGVPLARHSYTSSLQALGFAAEEDLETYAVHPAKPERESDSMR